MEIFCASGAEASDTSEDTRAEKRSKRHRESGGRGGRGRPAERIGSARSEATSGFFGEVFYDPSTAEERPTNIIISEIGHRKYIIIVNIVAVG